MPSIDPAALVDPELRAALDLLPPLHRLSAGTLPAVRAALTEAASPVAADDRVALTPVRIPADPPVAALLYRPSGRRARGAMLWLHGGGYVAGTAQRDDPVVRRLAERLDCVILSVDYRLAPETPFPGALDDAYAALDWLHAQADQLDVDRRRIVVRGNSAGGGLAAGLALRARDEGRLAIALLQLVYPMLDDRTGAHPVAGREVWTEASNRFGWASYLGGQALDGAALGYAVPARADDLAGLPPVWIGCGTLDLFIDENMAFAQRLIAAGVATELHVVPGAFHGFNLVASAGVAQRFERDLVDALARGLGS